MGRYRLKSLVYDFKEMVRIAVDPEPMEFSEEITPGWTHTMPFKLASDMHLTGMMARDEIGNRIDPLTLRRR